LGDEPPDLLFQADAGRPACGATLIPTVQQSQYIALMRGIIASRRSLNWILPSYICAEVTIESGWDPVVVNATGRRDGLMQVIPSTVREVEQAYGVMIGAQTDPYSSFLAGILYFDRCARKILAARGVRTLYLYEVAESYNLGYGGFLKGARNDRYGLKMLAAQEKWAFVDTETKQTVFI
jgi:soluble lytic murein transglycosylase-like protein